MNELIKKILFSLNPETAHALALKSLQWSYQTGLNSVLYKTILQPKTVMGLSFPNPIGLAAGFDKNADYVEALASLGFGFIEVGTLTPKPQMGNPRPRLFRLTKEEAIINRMGFNNKGVEHAVQQLAKTNYQGILGINIGKNKDTPLEKSVDDYQFGFRQLWSYASYITINISSPNTPGLRELQRTEFLEELLDTLKQEQRIVLEKNKKYVPLVVKISPDLSHQEVDELADLLLKKQVDGVIATNTTLGRAGIESSPFAKEAGGLSGRPLAFGSTAMVQRLHASLKKRIPIIASGGIMDVATAQEKINAGAELLQIYSGLIYAGPRLINQLIKHSCLV